MKGILIDPWERTIKEVHDKWGIRAMHAILSTPEVRVEDLNGVRLTPSRDTLWVDGEFGLKDGLPVWFMMGYGNPLAGRGLILGLTPGGGNRNTALTLGWVEKHVRWQGNMFTSGEVTQTATERGLELRVRTRPGLPPDPKGSIWRPEGAR